jgi:hypothetical protein
MESGLTRLYQKVKTAIGNSETKLQELPWVSFILTGLSCIYTLDISSVQLEHHRMGNSNRVLILNTRFKVEAVDVKELSNLVAVNGRFWWTIKLRGLCSLLVYNV